MPSDPSLYTYPSPLQGCENSPPLPTTLSSDNKSFLNPSSPAGLSKAYTSFPSPITNGPRGGFDIHIYYFQSSPAQTTYAQQLWERIRREFPELRVYKVWDRPVGPHPAGMFEVNLFTPEQYGAFIPWLLIHRGPLSALVHPNTEDEERDHSQHAVWLGQAWPLDMGMFEKSRKIREAIGGM